MFNINFSDHALTHLKALDKKEQKAIVKALERIRVRPETYLKKLVGDSGHKLRLEQYNLFIDVKGRNLNVLFGKKR